MDIGKHLFILLKSSKTNRSNKFTAKAIKYNQRAIDNQQFDNTFFNLLRTQQEIRNQIKFKSVDKDSGQVHTIESSDFFEFVSISMKNTYDKQINNIGEGKIDIEIADLKTFQLDQEQLRDGLKLLIDNLKNKDKYKDLSEIDKAKLTYSITFNKFHNQLGHYFRHLYHILKFTLENQKTELSSFESPSKEIRNKIERKYRDYANFVQAQMSSAELLVLFYNGICFKEMKKLIHLFDFLENLATEDLLEPPHKDFYGDSIIDEIEYPAVSLKSRENIVKK